MPKYTIKDLAEGKFKLRRNGTVEQLNKILSLAAKDDRLAEGDGEYYFVNAVSGEWYYGHENLPIVKVTDFLAMLEPEFTWGEEVEVSDDKNSSHYCKGIFIALNPKNNELPFVITTNSGNIAGWRYCRKIEPPLELTLQEIADRLGVRKIIVKD